MTLDLLTSRQREVALLAVRGLTNEKIGHRLGLAPSWIKQVLSQVYRVTDTRNRGELALLLGLASDASHRVPMSKLARLTERERRIFDLVGDGLTNKQIARMLAISHSVIQTHTWHICAKFGLRRRDELERLWARWEREGVFRFHPRDITPRELEVLQAIADGYSNKEIAHRLGISWQTVKNHVSNIFGKVGTQDRTQLAMLAVRNGWVSLQHDGSCKPNEELEHALRGKAPYQWESTVSS